MQCELYKTYVKLDASKFFFFQFVLLVSGIFCPRSYCSVVPYKRSSVMWTSITDSKKKVHPLLDK